MRNTIEISHKTIIFTVFFLGFLWLLLKIREIIFLIFVAFILMSAIKPLASRLEKYRIPRPITVLFIYITIIFLVAFTGSSILPPLITQSVHLGESLPDYLRSVAPFLQIDPQTIAQQIAPVSENLLKVTVGLFTNVVTIFTVFVISFYLLLEREHLQKHLETLLGEDSARKTIIILSKVEERLGSWVLGQLALALVIGLATFVGLTLLGLPYVLPLSILAGILEIVPIIGPIISAIPAILVALTITPFMALATAALFFVIQQAEGHLVVPFVMRRAVGLPPLITIIALMIGANLSGVGGALLAVPAVVAIETIVSEYLKLKSE